MKNTFQDVLRKLTNFWEKNGCIIHQGYDLEVGAGTFNPATFLRCLGPEPYNAAYIEPSRRPTDGRFGTNPNRLQHYFQYQVVLKPSPSNIQELYLESLAAIGFDLKEHDIRFVHDDWEAPTLGAWGLGWEVWMDGMEVSQFTYFQALGGMELHPITGEITYGIERLTMYLQKKESIFDIQWNDDLTYGDIYHRNEVEWSHYNFEKASTEMWFRHFEDYEKEAKRLIQENLPLPAYDFIMKASHAFNMLDARGVISVTERTGYIARIRDLSCLIAQAYVKSREQLGFPLIKKAEKKLQVSFPVMGEDLLNPSEKKREDFLLEIGCEELPATFVSIGCGNLEKNLRQLFEKENIPFESISVYGTPRRLAILIKKLAMKKPTRQIERKGPSIDQAYDENENLKMAGEGFFRSLQIKPPILKDLREGKIKNLSIQKIKGIDYLYAFLEESSNPTALILQNALPTLIQQIEFPKKMRWGNLEVSFARPLRWIACLYGKDVIPFIIGDILSGNTSRGHRQLDPDPFSISHPNEYLDLLKKHKVLVDFREREEEIVRQLHLLETEMGGKTIEKEKVLPQVLNLVEWPFLTFASFNEAFLEVPKEVLISEMVEHQKYFPVENQKSRLMNFFVITANTTPSDEIRQGNQRVLSSRLSDGVFLYKQDLKVPLEKFNEKLKQMTYQKKLGSVYDKVKRIQHHAQVLQNSLKISTKEKTERAAWLSKADLASGMIYEFPELQGIMGKYYALSQGEEREIAQAIEEHWMPKGEKSPLPETETGILLSLADKIDNLLGCFAIEMKPTSSSDPYALRRQVLGLIKMIIRGKYLLPLMEVFRKCSMAFPENIMKNREQILKEIETFITNRIKTVFLDYGFLKDEIEASLSFGFTDLYDLFCKVNALHKFRKTNSQFPFLYEVYKRARGQLQNHETMHFHPALLCEKAEKELNGQLDAISPKFSQALSHKNYDQAYSLVAEIQPNLATLFDEVKILADDKEIQNNRIALLQRVFKLFDELLDFSKIQY